MIVAEDLDVSLVWSNMLEHHYTHIGLRGISGVGVGVGLESHPG